MTAEATCALEFCFYPFIGQKALQTEFPHFFLLFQPMQVPSEYGSNAITGKIDWHGADMKSTLESFEISTETLSDLHDADRKMQNFP